MAVAKWILEFCIMAVWFSVMMAGISIATLIN